MTPKHFALIGAAGYVALRHMKAIRDTANRLVAALDISDSVGVIDSYFPEAHFFTEFERFDRHIDKLRRTPDGQAVNFVSICSPNYLHDAHMRFALRSNADAICEKPLVLNPWNIDGLQAMEKDTGRKVNTILQLRRRRAGCRQSPGPAHISIHYRQRRRNRVPRWIHRSAPPFLKSVEK